MGARVLAYFYQVIKIRKHMRGHTVALVEGTDKQSALRLRSRFRGKAHGNQQLLLEAAGELCLPSFDCCKEFVLLLV